MKIRGFWDAKNENFGVEMWGFLMENLGVLGGKFGNFGVKILGIWGCKKREFWGGNFGIWGGKLAVLRCKKRDFFLLKNGEF